MSYSYEFTEPAVPEFRKLDPWLAEEALDELEILAHNPPSSRLWSKAGFVHDFVRIREGKRFYVFLMIVPDVSKQRLYVMTVGSHVGSVNPPPP